MQKPFSLVIAVIVLVLGAAGMLWFHFYSNNSSSEPVACTMEAKICPDGSAVGRQGPRCEFAACSTSTIPDGWVSTTTNGIVTFSYPPTLGSDYLRLASWPPKITVTADVYACKPLADDPYSTPIGERVINGRTYCVTRRSEGAAGSTYTEYGYITSRNQRLVTLTTTIQTPQCVNYDEPKRTACETEQRTFDLDTLVDTIVQSVTVLDYSSSVSQNTSQTGEYVCVPNRDQSGPQTECVEGLKTDNGNYYALDFGSLTSSNVSGLQTGNRIAVEGSMVPAMALSSDHWQRYPIVGVISVTMLNRQ